MNVCSIKKIWLSSLTVILINYQISSFDKSIDGSQIEQWLIIIRKVWKIFVFLYTEKLSGGLE